MQIAATVSGVLAVVLFLLCFQLKTRKSIIICNMLSRAMYILQYILLFAFVGAAMDGSALLSSFIASKKDSGIIRRFKIPVFILVNAIILTVGILLYESVFSIAAILGVLFETIALWMSREQVIRILSLIAAPLWLVYNISCGAWGSAVGCVLTMISIIIALVVNSSFYKNVKKRHR
jgi:hypothetical protein